MILPPEQLYAWLRFLFSQTEAVPHVVPEQAEAWLSWLKFHQLASLAWTRLHDTEQLDRLPPPAVSALRRLVYFRMAVATTRSPALKQVLQAFQAAGIETVLLKGAALIWGNAYANPLWREMGDYDLWVQPAQMPAVMQCLQDLGYFPQHKPLRPLALRLAEQSEIEMIRPRTPSQAVDLHYQPFQGKWLGTVLPPGVKEELWQRREPITHEGISVYRLSNEDNLLHLAAHIAVNHQMGRPGVRALWDVAVSLQTWPVDWPVLLRRASAWHLRTALYLVLRLAAAWLAAPIPHDVLRALQPSPWRRACLQQILPPEVILRGATLSSSHRRYLYLLALLDEPLAGVSLVRQALLPQQQWLRLRYAEDSASPFYLRLLHFRRLLHSPRF